MGPAGQESGDARLLCLKEIVRLTESNPKRLFRLVRLAQLRAKAIEKLERRKLPTHRLHMGPQDWLQRGQRSSIEAYVRISENLGSAPRLEATGSPSSFRTMLVPCTSATIL